jgi:uncharacterized protein YxeA
METIYILTFLAAIFAVWGIIYSYNLKHDNNEKLIKNLEEYAKKEKTKQQKSKVLGQRSIKRTTNKKEKINV